MKKPFLPFELGMEYENWEFELEPINQRINGCDSYNYFGKIEIFGIKPVRIELIFYWDILVAVIVQINKRDLEKTEKLIEFKFIQVKYYFYLSIKKINSQIYHSLLC
ncbi:hypothetical protein [Moheibacter sediminis]|uniref:Uncharacterized protein n=1 Tax=Moheibacter sediminis TaxID=1434700 RepID=A0A1W1YC28_9FLAO|nr:hypothetical protein [Moheibacter sediminis]SMC33674.1 hypothetical protein SAMN06296427_101244 [Moheibacter sediminis]